MNPQPLPYKRLRELPAPDCVSARLARLAEVNAIYGGASALVALDRLKRSPHFDDYRDAVTQAYHASNGRAEDWHGYECPECGCAHLSIYSAASCCTDALDQF